MGCCCCFGPPLSYGDSEDEEGDFAKPRPLIRHRLRWRTETPLTERELRRKREEYWETAPMFEGRKEIWDALHAAAVHAEKCDYDLSQAILDGASITLVDGTLRECYDELGCRYVVPLYCLSLPQNILSGSASTSSRCSSTSTEGSSAQYVGTSLHPKAKGSQPPQMAIKLRISLTGEDLRMDVDPSDSVRCLKKRLHKSTQGLVPTASEQRWYFGGRLLGDRSTVSSSGLSSNCVVQVIFRHPLPIGAVPGAPNSGGKKGNQRRHRSEARQNEGKMAIGVMTFASGPKATASSSPPTAATTTSSSTTTRTTTTTAATATEAQQKCAKKLSANSEGKSAKRRKSRIKTRSASQPDLT